MNPYDILQIDRTSSDSEIKAAYKKMAMKFHPDVNKADDSLERFKEIQASYDMLRSDKPSPPTTQPNPTDYSSTIFYANVALSLEQIYTGMLYSVNMPTKQGRFVNVDIPAGISHGQHIFMRNVVQECSDYPSGSLNVTVIHKHHDRFKLHGINLYTQCEVDIIDLICGSTKTVVGIDGADIKIEYPENSNPNLPIIIKGKGMIVMGKNDEYGDLYVYPSIIHRKFTDDEIIILKQLTK